MFGLIINCVVNQVHHRGYVYVCAVGPSSSEPISLFSVPKEKKTQVLVCLRKESLLIVERVEKEVLHVHDE